MKAVNGGLKQNPVPAEAFENGQQKRRALHVLEDAEVALKHQLERLRVLWRQSPRCQTERRVSKRSMGAS